LNLNWSVAVDVMFPDATFTHAVAAFQTEFPATLLRFDVESSAVIEPVLDGRCATARRDRPAVGSSTDSSKHRRRPSNVNCLDRSRFPLPKVARRRPSIRLLASKAKQRR
jgi:hypothetical protein